MPRSARRLLLASLVALPLALGAGPIAAQGVPGTVTHEGLLLDADGLPRAGQVVLRFALYGEPLGGVALWAEELQLELVDGYYRVALGTTQPLGAVFGGAERYLGIAVDGGAELSPRHRLGSVPYAMVAANVVGDIEPSSVWVGGRQVIDEDGNWVGPPVPGAGDGVGYDTPAEVLAALRTVDGAGSGVDADMVDGVHAADFVQGAAQVLALLTQVDGQGSGLDADRLDGLDSSQYVSTAAQVHDLLVTVDGSGSSVDADRLDGRDSTQFLRSDADGTLGGNLVLTGSLTAEGATFGGTTTMGALRVAEGARVGVGVADPSQVLDVQGVVRGRQGVQVGNYAGACAAETAGVLRFTGQALEYCDGAGWQSVTGGGEAAQDGVVDPAALRAAILADGPRGYWPLDEQAGNVAYDRSGFARNGTYNGAVGLGQPGQAGRAANFGGTGYVSLPATIQQTMGAGQGTVTALVRLPDPIVDFGLPAYQIRHVVWATYAYWQGLGVATAHGVSGVHAWDFYTGNLYERASGAAVAGTWVHLAWVIGGGTLRLYLDGREISVASSEDAEFGGDGRMFIGAWVGNQGEIGAPTYPSQIQHVAVYPTALSRDRILAQAAAAGMRPGTQDNPGRGCWALRTAGVTQDGVYWIDPNGGSTDDAFQVYCDQTRHGGGWALMGRIGESARNPTAFTSDLLTANLLTGDPPGANSFEHFDLRRFDAWGSTWTVRAVTDSYNNQSHFQHIFFRPKPGADCTPGRAGTPWVGTDTHTRLLHLVNSTTTGLANATWLDTPPYDLAAAVLLFGYRQGNLGNQCLDGAGNTVICHSPAGPICNLATSGTYTAAFGYNDGVPHSHVRKATYWIKDANAPGAP